MEGFEILGISLIFFVAYLYLPAALFRFSAERYIDLQPRADSNDVEEFVSAAIPSTAIHCTTWILVRFVSFCPWVDRRTIPVVDWTVVATLVTGLDRRAAFDAIAEGPRPTIIYFLSVVVVSVLLGLMYGRAVLDRLERAPAHIRKPQESDPGDRMPLPPDNGRVLVWAWFWIRLLHWILIELAYVAVWKVSDVLLHENAVWLFRWSVQKPTVMVRTRGNRLYFGKFDWFEKKRTGEIEQIVLRNVQRYCYDQVDETISQGRLPFSDFDGSLSILWHEVADVHLADVRHFEHLRRAYTKQRLLFLSDTLLEQFDGETVGLEEIIFRRLGADHFTKELVEEALARLHEHKIVLRAADDKITFPRRRMKEKA